MVQHFVQLERILGCFWRLSLLTVCDKPFWLTRAVAWKKFSEDKNQPFSFGRNGSFEEYKTAIFNPPFTKSKYGEYQNYTEEFDFGHFYKPVGK